MGSADDVEVFRADSAETGDVSREDRAPVSFVERTDEGFLRARATVVARCGVQEYRRADGTYQRELRLPEHVFQAESLGTLDGKPIVLGHPADHYGRRVDAHNVTQLLRGVVSTPREDATHIVADVTLYDGSTIRAAEQGTRELSAGYRTKLVKVPGGVHRQDGCPYDGTHADVYQTRIKYNHVALVSEGRANEGTSDRPVSLRLDSAGNQIQESKKKMATININGKTFEVDDDVAAAYNATPREDHAKDLEAVNVQLKEMRESLAKAEARADAAEEASKKREEEAQSDGKLREDAEKFELQKKAEQVTELKREEIVRLDCAGLRREIVKALVPSIPKEKLENDAYVEARYDQIEEKEDSASLLRSTNNGTEVKQDAKEPSPLVQAFQERAERRNNVSKAKV